MRRLQRRYSLALSLRGPLPTGTIDDARLLGEVPFADRSVYLGVIEPAGEAALTADLQGDISRLEPLRTSVAQLWDDRWDGWRELGFPAAPTPEPSTAVLFGSALVLLAVGRCRHRRGPRGRV